jgi:hypothetical protein
VLYLTHGKYFNTAKKGKVMEYILFKQTEQPGKNGVTMWRLSFYCIDDGTEWEMTCDNTYRNFKRSGWDHVCNSDDSYGVYQGLRRTDRKTREGVPTLTADSKAKCIYTCVDQAEAFRLIEADLAGRTPTNFTELFHAA